MEENKKKFDWKGLVIVILAFMLLFCIVKIHTLGVTLDDLNTKVSNIGNSLSNDISSVYRYIYDLVEEEKNLVTSANYILGELDEKTGLVYVGVNIVPKSAPEGSELSLFIGDRSVELTKNGAAYTATFPISLFISADDEIKLTITSNGETRSQVLHNFYLTELYREYLPSIGHGSVEDYCPQFSNGQFVFNTPLVVSALSGKAADITRCELVISKNGEEIDRQDVPTLSYDKINEIEINKSYPIADGDEVSIMLVFEDSLGYIHKTPLNFWTTEENRVCVGLYEKGIDYIYDKDGNSLTQ